jgi:hypothetical protein
MSAVIQEPRQNIPFRKCGHCRQEGHNVLSCELARYAGYNIHNRMFQLLALNYHNLDIMVQIIKPFLQTLTTAQLKLLSHVRNDLNRFASGLYEQNLITLRQTGLHNKIDLVIVLGFYYKHFYYRNLNAIFLETQRLEEERRLRIDLQTPAEVRILIYPIIPAARKFNFSTEIVDSGNKTLFECPICISEVENKHRVTMNCNHDVCSTCFEQYLSTLTMTVKTPRCCLCRTNVTNLKFTDMDLCNEIQNKYIKLT